MLLRKVSLQHPLIQAPVDLRCKDCTLHQIKSTLQLDFQLLTSICMRKKKDCRFVSNEIPLMRSTEKAPRSTRVCGTLSDVVLQLSSTQHHKL